jgi:hypothetical protein
MILIYQPPNVHVWILLRNAMTAVKKIMLSTEYKIGLIFQVPLMIAGIHVDLY